MNRYQRYYQKNREKILAKVKKYQKDNPEKIKESRRKIAQRNKLQVLTHYGGEKPKCVCCKEGKIEFLCIDHIKGGGGKHLESIKKTGGNRSFYY